MANKKTYFDIIDKKTTNITQQGSNGTKLLYKFKVKDFGEKYIAVVIIAINSICKIKTRRIDKDFNIIDKDVFLSKNELEMTNKTIMMCIHDFMSKYPQYKKFSIIYA